MKKIVCGLLGAFALAAITAPVNAAPAIATPVTPAVFQADGTDAPVSLVQYRREDMRRGPPPRHHRHYERHRNYRPHLFRGH